jgi:TfoX/Sxy family transcriptional regulator of competence genes
MKKRSKAAKGGAAKTAGSGDVDPRFAPVIAAFTGDRQVTTGTMMASLGLKVNGRIFAMMVRGRFVAKLPRERVDEMVRLGQGERFDPRRDGRVMKEWLVAGEKAPPWIELAREAHRYVRAGKG